MQYTQPEVYEYISKETNDLIVERKICHVSGTKFPIYQSDLKFYEKGCFKKKKRGGGFVYVSGCLKIKFFMAQL